MSCHFTYSDRISKTELRQGDLLQLTPALHEVLDRHHKYFTSKCDVHPNRDKYPYFMVLTQSCDLVIRENAKCKTPYITLAAVRPLDVALKKIGDTLEKRTEIEKKLEVYQTSHKNSIIQLLERLVNNNHDEYFFLYGDNNVGLDQHYVAFLKVSIALKSEENYKTCLEAKHVELDEVFAHKLGWKVGNLYSRVGTEDFPENDRKGLVEQILENNFTFVNKNGLNAIIQKNENITEESKAQLVGQLIIQTAGEKEFRVSKVADKLIEIIKQYRIPMDNSQELAIRNTIKNNSAIKQAVKD